MVYIKDLSKSNLIYKHGELELRFTTLASYNRFISNIETEIIKTTEKLENVYKNMFNFDTRIFATIRFYAQCNKRGFYVVYKGTVFECQSEIVYQINNLMKLEN